ncbi:YfiR family protein [Thermodesulfobacteriota bacterium]
MSKSARLTLPLFCFLTLLGLFWPSSNLFSQTKEQSFREYSLKAVYLYNFLQFVRWPADKCLLNGNRMEEIGVIGDSPIIDSLQNLKAELKRTQNIEIIVRYLGPYVEGMDLSGCRLLFISRSEMKNIEKILVSVKDEPVLTVADGEESLEQGCMIVLLLRMNKVRWAVNRESAKQSGLRLSSRLLTMAVKIID